MSKIKELKHVNDEGEVWHHQYLYWCEGCGYEHAFALSDEPFGGHHYFNLDLNNPTVLPSLLEKTDPKRICHSYIRDGKIQYLSDCHHHLKGQTVVLLNVDEMQNQRRAQP